MNDRRYNSVEDMIKDLSGEDSQFYKDFINRPMNLYRLQATVNKLVEDGYGHLPVYVMLRIPPEAGDTIPSFHEIPTSDIFVVEDNGVAGSINIKLKGG